MGWGLGRDAEGEAEYAPPPAPIGFTPMKPRGAAAPSPAGARYSFEPPLREQSSEE